jgi:peptidoglycan/xylan/chitin deacetylase (PgdA/CDA1 family)
MDVDQRRARRKARRRELARRRKRGLAAVAVLVMGAVVVALLLGATGSPKSGSENASTGGAGSDTGGSAHKRSGSRGSAGAGGGSSGGSAGSSTSGSSTDEEALKGTVLQGHGPKGTEAVPILMYHVINPPPSGAKFPGLYVDPEELEAQMEALKGAGFHAVTMDQMLANWRRGAPLPHGKPVVVSFDNGYQSQLTKALPVLRKLGWVGVENIQLTGLPPSQGGLSHSQVAQLVKEGWELDTQGISHADLIALSATALHEQVAVAREELRNLYKVPVNWFCYPSGHYDATVIAAVKAAGYVGSTTVVPGWAGPTEDPYRLPRLRVLGGTSPEALLAEIEAIRSNPAPPASYGGG